MTRHVKEYCDVHGVLYPKQHIGDITYHTGTRVHRCSNIKEHFPKAAHIFGKWVRVIYDGQPERKRKPNNTSELDKQNESAQQNDQPSHTTPESPTIIEETPKSQLPTPTAINEITQNETQPTTNSPTNTTPNNVPHPTMDLTIDDFPTLTPDEINNQHQIKAIFTTTLWINHLQSPLTILYNLHSKDHAKPLPIVKTISTIHHSPKNNATAPYMSAESYTATTSATSTNCKI